MYEDRYVYREEPSEEVATSSASKLTATDQGANNDENGDASTVKKQQDSDYENLLQKIEIATDPLSKDQSRPLTEQPKEIQGPTT